MVHQCWTSTSKNHFVHVIHDTFCIMTVTKAASTLSDHCLGVEGAAPEIAERGGDVLRGHSSEETSNNR